VAVAVGEAAAVATTQLCNAYGQRALKLKTITVT
jgi:hypothetical protein